jgi:hypothetical protein
MNIMRCPETRFCCQGTRACARGLSIWNGTMRPSLTDKQTYQYPAHGPATVEMFQDLWRWQVATEIGKSNRAADPGHLFK